MGGKIEHIYQVEHWRKGVAGFDVIARVDNITVARTTFWAVVDSKGSSLFAGDKLQLCHGARIILQYPPEQARAAGTGEP